MPSMSYTVQSNQIVTPEEWIVCCREDLYDGGNPDVYQQDAEFNTLAEAEDFIGNMCELIHCGGERNWFRVVATAAVQAQS